MRKKRILKIIIAIVFLTITAWVLTGGIYIRFEDHFSYQVEESSEKGAFVPSVWIGHNSSRLFLFPLPFIIVIDRFPHTLGLTLGDTTFEESDEGFDSFTIERLEIYHGNQKTILLSKKDPIGQRTFRFFRETDVYYKYYKRAIQSTRDLKIYLVGFAKKNDGSVSPFSGTTIYEVSSKIDLFTLWQRPPT